MLSPDEFSKCFTQWVKALSERISGVVAIDGKTLRRSFRDADKRDCLHMVSAWSAENGLVLGQVRTNEKSNDRVGGHPLVEWPTSHTTVRTVRYTAVRLELAFQVDSSYDCSNVKRKS